MPETFDKDFKEGSSKFAEASKDAVSAYKKYQKAMLDSSPFDTKNNELILLAVSSALQCMYCIKTHSLRARNAGASDKEIAFAIHLAASVKHGATVSYGVNALADNAE